MHESKGSQMRQLWSGVSPVTWTSADWLQVLNAASRSAFRVPATLSPRRRRRRRQRRVPVNNKQHVSYFGPPSLGRPAGKSNPSSHQEEEDPCRGRGPVGGGCEEMELQALHGSPGNHPRSTVLSARPIRAPQTGLRLSSSRFQLAVQ